MLLVRLNGSSKTINLLSVPRDLRVDVPGEGIAKLNSAYSVGGPNLLVKVLKQQVFPGLQVNHIVDVNFGGFEDLVNAIGCVYTDVDHRYYNNTLYTDYSSINIQAGYQKLCGPQALQFVRFRHTDSDLVRNARQQDFIRWAKDQYGISNLLSNRDKLLRIFGAHTETDHNLHTTDGLINLFNLVAFSAGHTIKQIKFPAQFLPCSAPPSPCYVAPTSAQAEAAAFRRFMRPTTTPPRQAASLSGHGGRHHARAVHARAERRHGRRQGPVRGAARGRDAGLLPAPDHGPVAVLLEPDRQLRRGRRAPDRVRRGLSARLHDARPAAPSARGLPDDAGAQRGAGRVLRRAGHRLADPAAAGQPERHQDRRRPQAVPLRSGRQDHQRRLAHPTGVYWISNTLTTDITNQQMIAIAASLTRGN